MDAASLQTTFYVGGLVHATPHLGGPGPTSVKGPLRIPRFGVHRSLLRQPSKLLCPEQHATPSHPLHPIEPPPGPSSPPGIQQEHHSEGAEVLRVSRGQAEEAPAPGPGVFPPEGRNPRG